MSPVPRYSFRDSFHSNKSHASTVSLELSHHAFDDKSEKEMFEQLCAFGYDAEDIKAAMHSVSKSADINQLVEIITERAEKERAPIAYASPPFPSYAEVEQFPALPPSPKFANNM